MAGFVNYQSLLDMALAHQIETKKVSPFALNLKQLLIKTRDN